jgi:hypothetical protein
MKNLILGALLLLSTISFGQSISDVIVDSAQTKESLYSNALSFFATTFKSANAVIQMKDPESGKVIGKGLLSDGRNVTISISCKDGKYKYDIGYDEFVQTRLIELGVNKCGMVKGVTFLPVSFIGDTPSINVENSYFYYDKTYSVKYNGDHNILGLSSTSVDKWRIAVDEEFKARKNELSTLKPKKDTEINNLVLSLKEEMSKSDW